MGLTRSEHGTVAARLVPGLGAVGTVIRGWAGNHPLAAWVAGDGAEHADEGGGDRGRWSIVALPMGWRAVDARGGLAPPGSGSGPGPGPGGGLAPAASTGEGVRLPFAGGWIGWLSYDLGRELEATACGVVRQASRDRPWAGGAWMECPGALVHDGVTGDWWSVGEEAAAQATEAAARKAMDRAGDYPAGFEVGTMRDERGREAYERGVREVLERIAGGEVFQVNLARRLSGTFRGDARALFAALCAQVRPRHGCYAESMPGAREAHAVLSLSPELFLDVDLARATVATRPMKGTRPLGAAHAAALEASAKDRAELVMIVDLMRNDLGRVASFGSVRVTEPRTIERHDGGGVLQAVAEVRASLRAGVGLEEVLRATFPPGSVTGAPKVRAMRVIDELEGSRRGAYCGSSGFVSACGRAMLNVAIRTAGITGVRDTDGLFTDAVLDYGVGAGIVADSDPAAEFEETVQKAWAVRGLGAMP